MFKAEGPDKYPQSKTVKKERGKKECPTSALKRNAEKDKHY